MVVIKSAVLAICAVLIVIKTVSITGTETLSLIDYCFGILNSAIRCLVNGCMIFIFAWLVLYGIVFMYTLSKSLHSGGRNRVLEPELLFEQGPLVGESGDHYEEFYDMLEDDSIQVLEQPETIEQVTLDDSTENHRRRRRRMVSTLFWDGRDPSVTRTNAVRQTLTEVEDSAFSTPTSSPRPGLPLSTKSNNSIHSNNNSTNVNEYTVCSMDIHSPNTREIHLETQAQKSTVSPDQTKKETTSRFSPIITTHPSNNSSVPEAIILHQFPRGINKPCLSCDGMYLETYLRLIGVSFDVYLDCLDTNGPWICCGKEKIYGIKNCIKFLKEYCSEITSLFTVNGERSLANWSVTLLVDHLYWGLKCWRWIIENAEEFIQNQPGWSRICKDHAQSMRSMKTKLWSVGLGTMSYAEITEAITKDLESLSATLGNKPFILGETPTEVDCFVFSVLSQITWGHECFLRDKLRETINLHDYCFGIREMLWPDWEDQLASSRSDVPFVSSSKVFKVNTPTEDTPRPDETLSQKSSKTDFTKSFYQISPGDDDVSFFSKTESEVNRTTTSNGCSCDEDLLHICTRCITTEITTSTIRSVQSGRGHPRARNSPNEPIRLVQDGNIIHNYGVEEYFDDDFEDMETISFSTSHGESRLSPRLRRGHY